MKVGHRTLIALAGLTWFAIGFFLLYMGIHLILSTVQNPFLLLDHGRFSIIATFSSRTQDLQQTAIVIVSCCLFLGYLKGRFVLSKSVKRQVTRISLLPNPTSLNKIYSPGYYLLIASMMGLGMVLRFLPIGIDTRGAIDLTIGAALINGALLYFRYATTKYHNLQQNRNL